MQIINSCGAIYDDDLLKTQFFGIPLPLYNGVKKYFCMVIMPLLQSVKIKFTFIAL